MSTGAAGAAFRRWQCRYNQQARDRGAPPIPPGLGQDLPFQQREELLAFIDDLWTLPWFERVGLADAPYRERVTLREARFSRWPPLLAFPGASAALDHMLELEVDRDWVFDLLPEIVGDRAWHFADGLSRVVRWDVSKEASNTALYCAYEIALSDHVAARYFERLFCVYRDGHWPCDYAGDEGLMDLVVL